MREAMQAIEDFGADPHDILDIWGATLEASVRRRFDTGNGPGGIPWIPSERVLKAKEGTRKTLVNKGNLESSLRFETRPGEIEIGFDGAGKSSKFAYVHQFGFGGRVHVPQYQRTISQAFGVPLPEPRVVTIEAHDRVVYIPRREMLGIDDKDKADMRELALEHLRSLIDG